MDLRHGTTCVFAMHVHLVFVTKYRRKVFTQQVMRELKLIFTSVCKDFEATLIEFNDIGETARFISALKGPSFLASSG